MRFGRKRRRWSGRMRAQGGQRRNRRNECVMVCDVVRIVVMDVRCGLRGV